MIKFAFRNIVKNKVYSVINITGLAVSLAASVLLLLWVKDELSFDSFHKNADRIYITATQVTMNGKDIVFSSTPGPLAAMAKKEVPGIEDFCRITNNGNTVFKYNNKTFAEDNCAFADPSFFTMLSFPLIRGNAANPFTGNNSVVISESTAKKYFGNDDPIGKVLTTGDTTIFKVTGVMRDIPANSSIRYDLVFPMASLKDATYNWGNYGYRSCFLLKPGTNTGVAGKNLADMLRRYSNIDFTKNMRFILQPLLKAHLYTPTGKDSGMQIVQIFFIVACIILLIACINYVNLVTARATKRAKEISMRKIVGAGKWQLFRQFMTESALLFFIALLFSIVLIYLIMPLYNQLAGKTIMFNLLSPQVLGVFGVTMLVTLVLAGIYPALMLSSFKPQAALKGGAGKSGRNIVFRQVLVVVQFSFSIMLIASTIIIGNQLKYIRKIDLGFDKENIVTIRMRPELAGHYDAVKEILLKQPGITGVTASSQSVMSIGSGTADADWDGKTPEQKSFLINQESVDRNLLSVLNLQLAQGKGFTGTSADSGNYLLNETAIEQMGIKNPVGKRFTFHNQKGVIAGVVKDFHFDNMHNKISPLIIYYGPADNRVLYVKTTAQNASAAVRSLENIWKQYSGAYPFKYSFMDDTFNEMYKADQQVGKLFNCFAGITIFISCLGLLGLVTYTAETKVKEIGIRKALGAGTGNIVSMLSRDFVRLVVISSVIASPVAYWAMSKWLENYQYRTAISWWVFLVAALGAVVIAVATVGYQSFRAASANPVKALKEAP